MFVYNSGSWHTPRRLGVVVALGLLLAAAAGPAPLSAAPMLPISAPVEIWYAADAITGLSDGGAVATWSDLSGKGRHATQAASNRQPSYQEAVINGRPAVRFSSDFLGTADFDSPIAQPNNIFLVFRATNTNNRRVFDRATIPDEGTPNRQTLYLMGNTAHAWAGPPSGANIDVNFNDTGWNLHEILFDGANSYWRARGSTTLNHSGNFGSNSMGQLLLGTFRLKDSAYFRGDIAEFIVFDRSLNVAERSILESHLSAKYNLGVPDVKYTGYGAYDRDVFGVGRVGAANQVASGGLAGLAFQADNMDDDSWLLAGHNAPTNAWTTDDVPVGLTERWERVWYLDGTGDVGSVDVSFDFDAGGSLALDTSRGYYLLYSEENAFDFQILPFAGTIVGQTVTFAGVSGLADGFYTLGVPEPGSLLILLFGAVALLLWRRR